MATSASRSRAPLAPGTRAPAFTLSAPPDKMVSLFDAKKISLGDYAGSPVVLIFYPLAFSPVCTDELAIFNELLPEFQEQHRAQVLGLSVDSVWAHRAFARERNLHFPLLADFHPKGEVAQRYSVYREEDGFSERALYVIDGEQRIFWSHLSPIDVNPGADGVLDALERLSARQPQAEARP